MPTRLAVGNNRQLEEISLAEKPPVSPWLAWPAKILSVIFHPLFIPMYVAAFMVYAQPYLFAGFSDWDKRLVMVRFGVMYAFFPLVSVLLLKALGFISSIYLRTQRDRIIPYIICGIYYFWMWYVLKNQTEFPPTVVAFALAVFLCSSVGLIANNYFKVSMHAMALGTMVTFMFGVAFILALPLLAWMGLAVFVTGLVCTSRLLIADHTGFEIYAGLAIGILTQLVAFAFN